MSIAFVQLFLAFANSLAVPTAPLGRHRVQDILSYPQPTERGGGDRAGAPAGKRKGAQQLFHLPARRLVIEGSLGWRSATSGLADLITS